MLHKEKVISRDELFDLYIQPNMLVCTCLCLMYTTISCCNNPHVNLLTLGTVWHISSWVARSTRLFGALASVLQIDSVKNTNFAIFSC